MIIISEIAEPSEIITDVTRGVGGGRSCCELIREGFLCHLPTANPHWGPPPPWDPKVLGTE